MHALIGGERESAVERGASAGAGGEFGARRNPDTLVSLRTRFGLDVSDLRKLRSR